MIMLFYNCKNICSSMHYPNKSQNKQTKKPTTVCFINQIKIEKLRNYNKKEQKICHAYFMLLKCIYNLLCVYKKQQLRSAFGNCFHLTKCSSNFFFIIFTSELFMLKVTSEDFSCMGRQS